MLWQRGSPNGPTSAVSSCLLPTLYHGNPLQDLRLAPSHGRDIGRDIGMKTRRFEFGIVHTKACFPPTPSPEKRISSRPLFLAFPKRHMFISSVERRISAAAGGVAYAGSARRGHELAESRPIPGPPEPGRRPFLARKPVSVQCFFFFLCFLLLFSLFYLGGGGKGVGAKVHVSAYWSSRFTPIAGSSRPWPPCPLPP